MPFKRIIAAIKSVSDHLRTPKKGVRTGKGPVHSSSTSTQAQQVHGPFLVKELSEHNMQDEATIERKSSNSGRQTLLDEQNDGRALTSTPGSNVPTIQIPDGAVQESNHHQVSAHQVMKLPSKGSSMAQVPELSESMSECRSTQDRRFVIKEERLLSSPSNGAFNDALIPKALQPGAQLHVAPVHQGLDTVIDNADNIDGTFRTIQVRYDNDPTGMNAMCQRIMHDTGSHCSLIFESKINDLGLEFERIEYSSTLVSVTGEHFRPIGNRQIKFNYYDVPDVIHWAHLVVLKDTGHGLRANFDILFGRDTIRKTKALTYNKAVVGLNFVGHCIPTLRPLSVASGHELVLFPEEIVEDSESRTEKFAAMSDANGTTPTRHSVLSVIGST